MTDTNELRRLLEKATPGPWAVSYGDESWEVVQTKPDGTPDLFARRTAFDDGSGCGEYVPSCTGPTRDLIVAAVNALPAMLDELDAARADLREALELLQAHGQPPDWLKLGEAADWNTRYGKLLAKHKETP